jgi:hypothetical protein
LKVDYTHRFEDMFLRYLLYIALAAAIILNPFVGQSISLAQSLVSVTPDSAMQGQDPWVTISGTDTQFEQGTPSMISVQLDNSEYSILASGINVISPDTLQAFFSIPFDAPPDFYDLIVQHDYFPYTISLPDGFKIYADTTPALVSIEPDSGCQGDDLWVTITGVNTQFDEAPYDIVTLFAQGSQTIYALTANAISADSIEAHFQIPEYAPTGLWDVFVSDQVNPWMSLPNGFSICSPEPQIILIVPATGYREDNLQVAITGSHTDFGQTGSTDVWFQQASNTIQSYFVDVTDSEHLTASFNIPPYVPFGFYDVWVRNNLTSSAISALQAFLIQFRCGDSNADNQVNVSDAVWIINYVFVEGAPLPNPLESAEVNCDGYVNVSDAVRLINYVFLEGPAPCDCP